MKKKKKSITILNDIQGLRYEITCKTWFKQDCDGIKFNTLANVVQNDWNRLRFHAYSYRVNYKQSNNHKVQINNSCTAHSIKTIKNKKQFTTTKPYHQSLTLMSPRMFTKITSSLRNSHEGSRSHITHNQLQNPYKHEPGDQTIDT